MSIGKDGFTDCTFVCNPDNGMAWSCNEYCPDYVFSSTTLRTLTTATAKTNPHNFDTNESEDFLCRVVVVSCFAVLVLTILLVACCLNKRRVSTYFSKCLGKELQDTQQKQTQDEEAKPRMTLQGPGEDEKALLSFENENRSKEDDVNNFDHISFVRSKRPVNLPNAADFDSRVASSKETPSVQALTYANRPDQNRLQIFKDDTNHDSEDETELKEVGERAVLVIGQNSSFASKIMTLEPSTETAIDADNLDHGNCYENARNPDFDNADENSRETDASGSNHFHISNVTYEHNSNEIAVSRNEDAADASGGECSDNGDGDDGDDDDVVGGGDVDDDDNDDDDDEEEDDDDDFDENEEDEENRARITEGDHLLNNDNANHLPNKSRNTVSSKNGGILRVTTEINIREV